MAESKANPLQGADTVQTLRVERDLLIGADQGIVWESILAEIGGEMMDDKNMPMGMKIEPWPGGRWYRDRGNDTGHLWGHVQVIKPPALLEICGPMFMSYPVMSHIQYRLTPEGDSTRLKMTHRAVGLIDPEHAKGVDQGWGEVLAGIQRIAEARAKRS